MSMIPFTPVFQSWEKHFTVVQWERRGVGTTLSRNGRAGSDEWTFGLQAGDGIEVAEYLCRHLGQDRVIALGHSQGTIVRPILCRADTARRLPGRTPCLRGQGGQRGAGGYFRSR